MPLLEDLDLSVNLINVLPEELGKLTNLKKLVIASNKLVTLPISIGELQNLTALDCRSNELSEIPDTIGDLLRCQKMDFSNNMLTELPWNLWKLQHGKLVVLDVNYNPLIVPPKPILNKGTPCVLEWLRRNERVGRKSKVIGLTLKETSK